jgi:hypothetical protein
MRRMPAIPDSTRSSIVLRLLDHAEKNWPQLKKVQARYHASFAYITGVLPGEEQVPLFRLRYGGSAHSFGFAIYSAARDRYEDAVLLTGLPVGTPRKPSTPPAPSTWPGSGTNPRSNPEPTPDELTVSTTKVRCQTGRTGRTAYAGGGITGPFGINGFAAGDDAEGDRDDKPGEE